MARELCTCKGPIVVIDSDLHTKEGSLKIDQTFKFGCRNKNCDKYNVAIRTETVAVNY